MKLRQQQLLLLLASLLMAAAAAAEWDVIVVGAGLAGVTAARTLADASAAGDSRRRLSVLVVEARDRPGGRLYSVATQAPGGERVDLGGMWPHNYGPRCALTPLIERQLKLNVSRPFNYVSGAVFDADGSRAPLSEYMSINAGLQSEVKGAAGGAQALRAQEAAAAAAAAGGGGKNNGSIAPPPADVPLSALYDKFVQRRRPAWLATGRVHAQRMKRLADLVMHTQLQVLLNANATRLSALRFGDAKTLPAIDVLVRGGFDGVVAGQLNGLNVSYGTVVTGIIQEATGVTVTTSNGTRLRAKHALVTLSLGVLKARSVSFEPPLPAAKLAAIDGMGFGVLDKVVLVYGGRPEDAFWATTTTGGADFLAFAPRDRGGRWSSWLNYQAVLGRPILVALNAAETALDLEARTDAEVVAEALAMLEAAYGGSSNGSSSANTSAPPPLKKPLPRPVQAIVTRWAADPYARGSYSYYAAGNPRNITEAIAAPFGRVLFAGEAASSKPGTAEGAYLSGLREGRRLLELLQQRQK